MGMPDAKHLLLKRSSWRRLIGISEIYLLDLDWDNSKILKCEKEVFGASVFGRGYDRSYFLKRNKSSLAC